MGEGWIGLADRWVDWRAGGWIGVRLGGIVCGCRFVGGWIGWRAGGLICGRRRAAGWMDCRAGGWIGGRVDW